MEISTVYDIIGVLNRMGYRFYPEPVPGSEGKWKPDCHIIIEVSGRKPRPFKVLDVPVVWSQRSDKERNGMYEKIREMYVDVFHHKTKQQ